MYYDIWMTVISCNNISSILGDTENDGVMKVYLKSKIARQYI